MKFKDLSLSKETMQTVSDTVLEKFRSLNFWARTGQPPEQVMVTDVVLLEVKLNALIQLLEEKHEVSFAKFDAYMKIEAQAMAVSIANARAEVEGNMSHIVKPPTILAPS